MVHPNIKASVAAAQEQAVKVESDVRAAEASLHESTDTLREVAAGDDVSPASLEASITQNSAVQEQLHGAADELGKVTDLLEKAQHDLAIAEAEIAESGSRSGAGVDSLMPHLSAYNKSKQGRRSHDED